MSTTPEGQQSALELLFVATEPRSLKHLQSMEGQTVASTVGGQLHSVRVCAITVQDCDELTRRFLADVDDEGLYRITDKGRQWLYDFHADRRHQDELNAPRSF